MDEVTTTLTTPTGHEIAIGGAVAAMAPLWEALVAALRVDRRRTHPRLTLPLPFWPRFRPCAGSFPQPETWLAPPRAVRGPRGMPPRPRRGRGNDPDGPLTRPSYRHRCHTGEAG